MGGWDGEHRKAKGVRRMEDCRERSTIWLVVLLFVLKLVVNFTRATIYFIKIVKILFNVVYDI
jgi:hypothetical protein